MKTNHYLTRPFLLFFASLVMASVLSGPATASSNLSYPLLPDLPGADIQGEARIVIHLDEVEPLVEDGRQLFALGGRPLEIGFGDLDHITLLIVVPLGARVFVIEDGQVTDEIDPPITSEVVALDVYQKSGEVGLAIALPGQPAPTVPDVVIRPTDDDPEPR